MAFLRTSLVFFALLAGVAAQAPISFDRLREDFEKGFQSRDPAVRREAIEAISEYGHPENVRYLVGVLRSTLRNHEALREAHSEASARTTEARRELDRVRGLVKQAKLGQDALGRAEADHAKASAEAKELLVELTREAEVLGTLRRALGWVVARCTEHHQATALRIVLDAPSSSKSPAETIELYRMLAWVDHPRAQAYLEERLHDADTFRRLAALRAYEERGGLRARRAALATLEDDSWPIRAQAIRLLRQVGGQEAVAALIDVLGREDGRLIGDAIQALRKLTGEDFHDNVHLWRDWLARNGDSLPEPTETGNAPPPVVARTPPKKTSNQQRTGFYGIESTSKHLVYVLDYSGSMDAALSGDRNAIGPDDRGPARVGGPRKVDGVVTELLRSVETLSPDSTFNVVLFASEAVVWQKTMQKATPDAKEKLREWVLSRPPAGSTNLFDGLERAFAFAGRGSFDKRYRVEIDTIFLLSDGSPTAGRLQAPADILREVKAINDLRRIAIHCIGLGRQLNVGFLRNLAEQNDGQFVHITR